MRNGSTIFQILAFLVIGFLLTGMAVAQESSEKPEEAADAVTTTPDTVSVEDIADDSKITQRLQGIFESSGWFETVDVSSQNGFVKISGKTTSDEHREWAEKIASRTTDVIGVSNNLEVESKIDFRQSLTVVGNSLDKLYRDFLLRIPFFIAGFFVVVLTWLASKILGLLISTVLENRSSVRSSLRDLFKHLASITIWIIGFLLATVVVFPGMTPAKALTVLGLGSVAIGFAFKDIFENFFAGVLILWRYPIEKGDFIQHGEVLGKVEEITIRNTMIRRTDGELVVVPNGQLFKSNVEVLTNRPKRRVRIDCGVGYGEDFDHCRDVIRNAVSGCESISGPKSVEVFANEFGESSINFEVAWWTGATPLEIRKSRDEVIAAIKSSLDKAKVEIPFPYRTLTFADSLKVGSHESLNATQAK